MRGFSERPERLYRSVRDWIAKRFLWSQPESTLRDPNFWPCLECGGKGKVHKEEDRDCIEGYKLAPWYQCEHCAGTGEWPKAKVKEAYQEVVKEFKARLEAWKAQDALRRSGLRKLSEKERQALGL